jgi:hypothetical protein
MASTLREGKTETAWSNAGMVKRMRTLSVLAFVGLLVACQTATELPASLATASPPQAVRIPTPHPTLTGWGELRPAMPTARSEVASVVFAGTVFVIGGLGAGTAVERYVPISAAWRREPDLPIAVDHAMAAAVPAGEGFGIYVFGGAVNGQASSRSFHLPAGADSWQEIARMPAPRMAGAAVTIGRRIYVVGGAASASALHKSIYAYDIDRKEWRIGPDMPTARDHLAAVAVRGKVCAVGGRMLSMSRNLGAVECFDPATDKWEAHAEMPTPRGGLGAAAIGDKIVAVGGERPEGTFADVEVLDLATGTWSRGQNLVHPRHGLGVVAIDRVIYAIGGGTRPGGGSETGIVEYWNLP